MSYDKYNVVINGNTYTIANKCIWSINNFETSKDSKIYNLEKETFSQAEKIKKLEDELKIKNKLLKNNFKNKVFEENDLIFIEGSVFGASDLIKKLPLKIRKNIIIVENFEKINIIKKEEDDIYLFECEANTVKVGKELKNKSIFLQSINLLKKLNKVELLKFGLRKVIRKVKVLNES